MDGLDVTLDNSSCPPASHSPVLYSVFSGLQPCFRQSVFHMAQRDLSKRTSVDSFFKILPVSMSLHHVPITPHLPIKTQPPASSDLLRFRKSKHRPPWAHLWGTEQKGLFLGESVGDLHVEIHSTFGGTHLRACVAGVPTYSHPGGCS